MVLEIVIFNYTSAIFASKWGADRLELCDNSADGGTTPSFGMVEKLRDKTSIPLFPMIRPRGGDFLYSLEEVDVMRRDIVQFKKIGCAGVVLGCLQRDGTIDYEVLTQLVEDAYPMEVTFHRAFDRVRDRSAALQLVYEAGCKRILTSGGTPSAIQGMSQLQKTVEEAKGKLIVVAGGNVTAETIPTLLSIGVEEIHSPARKQQVSKMKYVNPQMNESLEYTSISAIEMRKMRSFKFSKKEIE